METQIIILFCIIDDYLKASGCKDDIQVTMSTAEIMTVAVTAGMFFGGNYEKSRAFFKDHHYVRSMLSKSQFNRRLNEIPNFMWQQLQHILGQAFIETNDSHEYLADSFPVSVCQNIRISRSKIYRSKEYRGYCASKRQYFYGIRVHMVSTINQEPVELIFAPGSVHDVKIFRSFNLDLPKESTIYTDSANTDYEYEDILKEAANITLFAARKENSKRKREPYIEFLIQQARKKVETTFSRITALFPKKIHAVTAKGFELKIFCFILAYSFSLL